MATHPALIDFPLPDLQMVLVEGGIFSMGDDIGDLWDACLPVHQVKLDSFYIGKFPVTQGLWQAIAGNNASRFIGEKRPVEQVSWDDALNFIQKLNMVTQKQFRLPTEAEWEFAARGGRYRQGYEYAGSDKLKQVGWYNENSDIETRKVGLLLANELGIHDMSGNVWEWCEDWFEENYYQKCQGKGIVENPAGANRGVSRVMRGGGYFYGPLHCRPSYRGRGGSAYRNDGTGFRLALSLQSVG